MKKFIVLFGLFFVLTLLVVVSKRADAAEFIFEVNQDSGNNRLALNAHNIDFDTNINAFEYNYGRGWLSVDPLFGTNFGENTSMYAEIPYYMLPKMAVNIEFRIVDSNNDFHNLPTYMYPGEENIGCEYYYCPIGSPYIKNEGNEGNPIFQDSNHNYLGDGVTGNEITTSIETNEYDTIFVATLHYRSNSNQIKNINFYNEYFKFGCINRSAEYTTEIWYLSGINNNSGDVVARWDGDVDDAFITVAAISNVDMANPVADVLCNVDEGWATSHSIELSTDSTQFVYAGATTYSGGDNDITPDGSMTEVVNERIGNVSMSSAYKDADDGTTTMSWTGGNEWPWSAAMIVLNGFYGEDDVYPEINFTDEPSGTEDVNFSLSGTAVEETSIVSQLSLKLYNNDNFTVYLSTVITPDDGILDEAQEEFTYNFTNIPGGSYYLEVSIADAIGNTNGYAFYFDVTSDNEYPTYHVNNLGQTPMIDNTPTWTGSATDNESNIDYIQYRIINATFDTVEVDWTDVTPTDGAIDSLYEEFTFTSPPLTDGVKYVLIRTADVSGNESPTNLTDYEVDRVIIDVVDLTAPNILVKDITPNDNPDVNLKISGKVEDSTRERSSNISAIYYQLDGGGWISINSIDGVLNDEKNESFEVNLSNLTLGTHTIEFRAVDASGNDTDAQSLNLTKTFNTITQPDGLVPTNIETTIEFNSNSYADFTDSDGLIWGNGRLRLAEQFTPVGTEISTSSTQYGPKYGFEDGAWAMDRSATNGYWVAKSRGGFAYHSFATNTEYDFHTSDYYGGSGPTVYDIKEIVSNGEYHVWMATGQSILGINFGTSITDGVGDTFVIRPISTSNVRILEIDKRNTSNYGVYVRGDSVLFRISDFTFPNTTDNSSTEVYWVDYQGYLTNDITAIYLDPENNDIWLADYNEGISRINDNGTPEDTSDDETTLTYPDEIAVFDIGMDDEDNLYFVGNSGLKVVTDTAGTPNDGSDDSIETIADQVDLNIDVGARAVYWPGVFPVEDQFFVANRAGEMYYISTNGTYEDHFDDQIVRLPLTNIYPTAVRDFYMPDDNTVIVVLQRSGVWSFNLNRQFVANGFTTTKIDPQVANYLNADFLKLESFTRIDNTEAVVTYKASNSGGTTLLTLAPGEAITFPGDDHRVVFSIEMFRGSTPVLADVTFSYSAYPQEEVELDQLVFSNLPTTVYSGDTFSFDITALDTLGNLIQGNTNATVSLIRNIDSSVIGTFNISDIVIVDGTITIPNAVANSIGNHHLHIVSGSVSADSSTILFTTAPAPTPTPTFTPTNTPTPASNNDQQGNTVVPTPSTNDSVEPTPEITSTPLVTPTTIFTNGPETESGPKIDKFIVTEKVVNGELILVVEWSVSNADAIEISGIGENLPSSGVREVKATEGMIIQILAIDDEGNETYRVYKAENVQSKINIISSRNNLIFIPLLLIIVIGLIYLFLELLTTGKILLPFAFIFFRKKEYTGIVYAENRDNPVPYSLIKVLKDGNEIEIIRADKDGYYFFEAPQKGGYTFIIEMKGFKKYESEHIASKPGPFNLDIKLNKDPKVEESMVGGLFTNREFIFNTLNLLSILILMVGAALGIILLISSFSIPILLLVIFYCISLIFVFIKSTPQKVIN